MVEPLLSCENLGYRYTEEGNWVFRDLLFRMGDTERVAIQGTSGVGKTTLLEILGTMRGPREGHVFLGGDDVYERGVEGRSDLRGRYLGFVFQESLLLPDLTVWENCRLAVTLSQRSWPIPKIRRRYEELLRSVGLDPDRGSEGPSNFSTGERQRLALVRSVMHQPELLIADEPTGNLDERTSRELIDLLLTIGDRDDMAILVATHDRNLASAMDRTLQLQQGTLVSE